MTDARPTRGGAWLAWAWLAVVLALAVQQIGFWRASRIDSDVMALLPGATGDPLLAAANARMADAGTRQVVVLLSAADWTATRAGAVAFVASLRRDGVLVPAADAVDLDDALAFYAPFRRGVLTPAQRERLSSQPADRQAELALARLFGPASTGGLGAWQDDPLGLWPDWWQARAGLGVQPRDGLLSLRAEARDWAVLRLESRAPAFQLDGRRRLQDTLADATGAASAAAGGDVQVWHGGVPLHAEAAAVQASREVGTIGLGSLLAVIALVWLAFRSPRPVLLVAVSLAVGTAAGVAVTAMVFGQVHLLTLVFGSTLVGVAEDYGIHWFASRQGHPDVAPRTLMRQLLPALALALVTSALAYLALGIAPFPGLRQMAVFAASGLAAAFLTVVLWFPWLDRRRVPESRFATAIAHSLGRWPRWRGNVAGAALAVALAAVVGFGLARLQVLDDLRSLQNSPAALLEHELRIGALLGLPSPAQFFLVEGADPQQLLEREEALTARLDALVRDGALGGWRAVSDWLPSASRQAADAARVIRAEAAALARARELTGEPFAAPSAGPVLEPDAWLAQPVSAPLRPLWLGRVDGRHGTVVMLTGVQRDTLPRLAGQGEGLDGVRWIDRTAGYSALLGHYRRQMSWLLLAGYAAVAVVLAWRFGRSGWRALLPTALAALFSLAALGWLGVPLQLFGVLAQLLLLGMGVDYGIFLLEHRGDPASWLAVSLGAASTLLAFGLLALSATPALHSFGLTLLFGIGAVWLLSPCLRADAPADPSH